MLPPHGVWVTEARNTAATTLVAHVEMYKSSRVDVFYDSKGGKILPQRLLMRKLGLFAIT